MDCTDYVTHVEVFIETAERGLAMKSVNNSKGNGTVIDLNFENGDELFADLPAASIDVNAITVLNLSHSNLQCIPDAFGILKLSALDLSHNAIEYPPDCLRNGLRTLQTLDLSHNKLRSFEIEPKCVAKLRILNINNNRLLNIPDWILEVNAFNLEELNYSHNETISCAKSQFHRVASYRLKKLELRNCLLRATETNFLKNVRTLTELDLGNAGVANKNYFSDVGFSDLFQKPLWDERLTVLRLNNLPISFLPEEVGHLVGLQELYLANNDLMWLPESLNTMHSLRVLDISYNSVVCLPTAMDKLANLDTLMASHNKISGVPDFSVTNLRVLDLYDNYLHVDCDIKINTIKEVDLERNYFSTQHFHELGYEEKRNALRLSSDVQENRLNGFKEQLTYQDDVHSETTDSDWDGNEPGGVEGESNTALHEESWSPKLELCEDGCTASDEEWTGREQVYFCRKIKQVSENPDWMFEDD